MLKIMCQNREITSYVESTRVTLFSGVISVENLWTKRKKLDALKCWLIDSLMAYCTGVPMNNKSATQL